MRLELLLWGGGDCFPSSLAVVGFSLSLVEGVLRGCWFGGWGFSFAGLGGSSLAGPVFPPPTRCPRFNGRVREGISKAGIAVVCLSPLAAF